MLSIIIAVLIPKPGFHLEIATRMRIGAGGGGGLSGMSGLFYMIFIIY